MRRLTQTSGACHFSGVARGANMRARGEATRALVLAPPFSCLCALRCYYDRNLLNRSEFGLS